MSAVEDAIRRQMQVAKRRPSQTDESDDNPALDAGARSDYGLSTKDELGDTIDIKDVPPGKAFGPGAVEGPVAPEQGPLSRISKDTEPRIASRKPHPDPHVEEGLRILGELDMHNAGHESEIQRLVDEEGLDDPNNQRDYEHHSREMEHNKKARSSLLRNIVGLSDAYYAKDPEAKPADEDTGPGVGSKIWEGLKTIGKGALDTGKYAVQHPIEAAKDIGRGAERLATLPERFVAGALPEGTPGKGLVERFHKGREEELAKSHKEAGVEGETGPAVMGAVGEATLPVGPTIKAGQMLRNVVKGGGTTAGIYAGEQTANQQEITPEGLGGAAAVGGGLAGVLGKLVGKGQGAKAAAKENTEPSAGATGTPDMPPGSGPAEPALKQITERPGGTIYGEAPLKQLPAPPQAEGMVPEGAVEIPVHGFNRQFSKVWRTPDGSLIGETRGGEIIRADKQPTPLSIRPEGMPERGQLQQLLDAKRLQRDSRAMQPAGAEPPNAAGQRPMPEQPFSGQPQPGVDLTAKPLPTAKPPVAPQPQMQPAASAQPKPQVMGPPAAGAPPLKVVNPTPQAQENVGVLKQLLAQKQQPPAPQPAAQPPSMLKQVLGREEPQPVKDVAMEVKRPEPKVEPKTTSAKVSVSEQKPQIPAGKNTDMIKWAKQNEFEVREFPGTGKVEIRNPMTGEKVVEFSTKDPTSRAKAAATMQRYEQADEKSTVKLYSGIDVGEAYKGATKLARELKARGSALFGEGHDEHSPLLRGLKTGAALQRGGKTTGKIVTNANEAERMEHKVVEDLRYEEKPGGGYKETQFELYMRMPESERAAVDRVVRDFDKLERIPTHEEMVKADHEYLRLTPAQKAAVHGTQEFSNKIHKYMQGEIKERVLMGLGKKTGEFTPKVYKEWLSKLPEDERKVLESLEAPIGKKEFYYPHRWDGHFEVHEVDPGTGISIGKKFIKEQGSSSVRTMYQANRMKQQAIESWGVPVENVKVIARDQPGASKHLETRKGAEGYEQEKIAETYLDYARSVAHWVEMSKMQRVAGDLLKDPKLGDHDKAFLLKYVERVAGKPAAQDMFLNHLMQHVPILRNALDPYVPFSHLAKGARQFTTATALGVFNAASALVNADGVARHVWPALARLSNELKLPALSAEKYGANAIKAWTSSASQTAIDKLGEFDRSKAFSAQLSKALNLNQENKNLLQKMAHEGVLDIQLFGERLPPAEKKAEAGMRAMMALFATTEDFSRGVASVAAYRMARDAGQTEAASLQKAFQLTSSALGRYSKAGKPMVYSSELGGTLGIFKTYLHVMIDNAYLNMRHPVKDFGAFSRYALAAIGISGLTGLYPGTQDIDELATKAFGKSPLAWLHQNLPLWVVDGIPTLFGTDLSSRAGAPEVVPNKGEDWLGAVYSKVAKPIGSLAQASYQNTLHLAQGEPTSFLDDILPALKQAAPNTVGLRYILSESEDALKGGRNRTIIKDLSPQEKAIKAFGLPVNREVQARQQYQVGENLKSKWQEERKRLVDLFLSGDEPTRDKWSSLSHKYGITPRMLREEAKRKGQTLSERQRKSLPKPLRHEMDWEQAE